MVNNFILLIVISNVTSWLIIMAICKIYAVTKAEWIHSGNDSNKN